MKLIASMSTAEPSYIFIKVEKLTSKAKTQAKAITSVRCQQVFLEITGPVSFWNFFLFLSQKTSHNFSIQLPQEQVHKV